MDALDSIEKKTINVLDHGYVQLVDVMPRILADGETCDTAIVDAARISYQEGTVRKSTDQGLINYLMRHRHTSPFEMIEFKFQCRMPIFVAREWVRHRTASLNEESARYSQMRGDFYLPESVREQSTKNRQATEDIAFNPEVFFVDTLDGHGHSQTASQLISETSGEAYQVYTDLLNAGVAREQARMVLPVNLYTSWVWKIDLHNLLHFLKLRLDSKAQYEIRVYAQAIAEFVKQTCPWTWEAFEKYVLNSVNFSAAEMIVLRQLLNLDGPDLLDRRLANLLGNTDLSAGEILELKNKLVI